MNERVPAERPRVSGAVGRSDSGALLSPAVQVSSVGVYVQRWGGDEGW